MRNSSPACSSCATMPWCCATTASPRAPARRAGRSSIPASTAPRPASPRPTACSRTAIRPISPGWRRAASRRSAPGCAPPATPPIISASGTSPTRPTTASSATASTIGRRAIPSRTAPRPTISASIATPASPTAPAPSSAARASRSTTTASTPRWPPQIRTRPAPTPTSIPPWFAVASFTNPHDIATYPGVIAQALPDPDSRAAPSRSSAR